MVMEQMVVEYLANALWQLPVLATGAWLLLRMWKPGPAAQHWIWLAVLGLGLVLPLRGAVPAAAAELPVAGASRFAPLSSHDGQIDSPQRTQRAQRVLGAGSGLAASAESAGSVRSARADGGRWVDFVAAAFSDCVQRVSVSAAAALWVAGIWLAVMLLGLVRLAGAWRAARRLVSESRAVALRDRERTALLECAGLMGVAAPEVRESGRIAGPVVVGAFAPVLLWPERFEDCSDDELRAALCHELAHVRRRDYAMNLLCETAGAPLKWHPAAHGVGRRIRATREMACDAAAAAAMESETVYAECLVSLARSIAVGGLVEGSVAAGLFNGNVMEERVMRLMQGGTAMSWRARVARGLAGAAAMTAAVVLAGAFHVAPAMAQTAAAAQEDNVAAPAEQRAVGVPDVSPTPAVPKVPAVAPVPKIPATPAVPKIPAVAAAPKVPAAPRVPIVPPTAAVPKVPAVSPVPPVPQRAHHSKPIVMLNERQLTPAERARIEKQLEKAQRRIAEATAKINSPEFRRQIAEAQRKAFQAQTMLNSAEFKQKMADAQKQIAEASAKMNSPKFQKQMADAQSAAMRARTMVNSAEFQKQMADAQKQIAMATARLNSPEFKRQMEEAARAATKVNSAEFQKQMAEAQKQVDDALARMKAEGKTANRH